jgi:LacI family transcriptional regulator
VVGVFYNSAYCRPPLQHPFLSGVLQSFVGAVGGDGYDVLIPAIAEADGDHRFLEQIRRHRLAGMVVLADRDDAEVVRVTEADFPVVGIDVDFGVRGAGCVTSANAEGARLAVRHLHELGHRRIATICGTRGTLAAEERLRGYRLEMAALRLAVAPEWVEQGDFDDDDGAAAERLLSLPEPPTAVFAACDLSAATALEAAARRGARLAVVGFDDGELAARTTPPLTTIRQDRARLGAEAARLLAAMVEHGESAARTITVPVELVVRESCGAAA